MAGFEVIVICSTLLILYYVSTLIAYGLWDLPGPALAKISNLWRFIATWKGHLELVLRELHREHGKLVQIGPNVVSIADPDAIETIYGIKADLPKGDFNKPMHNYRNGKLIPTLVTATDQGIHRRLRTAVAHIFSMSTLVQLEPGIDETILDLIQQLAHRFAEPHRSCDIHNWLRYFGFDAIGRISFSRPFGFIERSHDIDYMLTNQDKNSKYLAVVGQMPWLDRLLRKNPLFPLLPSFLNPFSAAIPVIALAGQIFGQRMADEKTGKGSDYLDMTSRILAIERANPDQIPDQAVIGYNLTFLQAGSDTVSIALRTIIYYLSKNPPMQRKLQAEIDAAKLTYPVTWKAAQHLIYLDAVIKEALRIHSPAGVPLERVVPPTGLNLPNGRYLKPGTIASMTPWTLSVDEDVFGKDATNFNPDRWLKGPDESEDVFHERLRKMKRADLVWGHGPRSCIGKPIAQLEMYKLVPTLFGLFDMRLANPELEWRYGTYIITGQCDMDVVISWREDVDRSILRR